MGLALDEPKDNDEIVDSNDVKFLVDNDLMKNCGNITVDYADAGHRSGFSITSTIPVGGGGGCSGGSCSSGSCG